MLVVGRSVHRGDTLIEVLFAVTVFSLVAVSGLSIMNQGTATAQRSLEITLVRQEIDAQAETLRFIHDSYVAAFPHVIATEPSSVWNDLVKSTVVVSQAAPFGSCVIPSRGYILNPKTAKVVTLTTAKPTAIVQTYAQLRYSVLDTMAVASAEGIWIESVPSPVVPGDTSGYIDFHIRACWQSPGQAAPMTLGTIVRLYEPR